MKIIKLWEPIYRADIRVVVNCSFDDFKKHILKKLKVEIEGNYHNANGKSYALTNGTYIIWVGKFNWTIECQRKMIHELLHVAVFVIGDRGIEINKDEDEALAYYYSFLFAECWNKLQPVKRKKNVK